MVKKSKSVRVDRATLKALLHAGNLMANICFNTSQPGWTVTEHDRKHMKLCQNLWDEHAMMIHHAMKGG